MKKTKFIRLFTSLKQKEQDKFIQFVTLMYARQKKAIQLLNYIHNYKNHTNTENYLDKRKGYFAVFSRPMLKKNEKNFSNLLSDLTNWLENFFICEAKDSSFFTKNLYVANLYKNRGLNQDYLHKLNYAKRETSKSNEYYWSRLESFLIEDAIYFDPKKEKHKLDGNLLLQANRNLDEFYLLTKLRYACEIKTRNYVFSENHHEISTKLIDLMSINEQVINPKIQVFNILLKLLENRTKANYLKFKELLFNVKLLDNKLHLSLLIYAANFTASQIRIAEDYYTNEAIEIYQFCLDSKLILANGTFPEIPFMNIVNLYCHFNQHKKAFGFINKWKIYLQTQSKKSIAYLCKVRVMYNQGNYLEGIEILKRCKFEDSNCEVELRTLKIRLLYEVSEFEEAFQACNALENHCKRNKKLSFELKRGSINFAKITRRMISRRKKDALIKSLSKVNYILCSTWLKKKIHILEN